MTEAPVQIVTAAAGRRDDYQVPIALATVDLLACHVTDVYAPDVLEPLLGRLGSHGRRILRRHSPLLPSRLVHCSGRLAARKAAATFISALSGPLQGDQDPISWSALRQARRHHAALLLYAGYAYRAFTAEPRSARKRGLIQYHPHIRDSAAILRADAERYPFIRRALEELRCDEQDQTNITELEIADVVICNSSFTAATCRSLGIDPDKFKVIPYGIDPVPISFRSAERSSQCQFIFVGSGIQRKGLHHLLLAWRQANLTHSQLTIVSRQIDPEIRSAIDPGEGVLWLDSVSNQELDQLYRQSDVFVLPSLIEGFGYVFLEAMARGCFCIGTANTGLPDIGDDQCRRLIPAGEPRDLAESLRDAEAAWAGNELDQKYIALKGAARDWTSFRSDLLQSLSSLIDN